MKRLGVLLLHPGWDASPSQGTQHEATRNITAILWMVCYGIAGYPPVTQYFDVMVQPGTHLNTWVERDKVGKEHNE